MYSKITDPKSGSEVNIHSKSGINIIKKYIISHGGAQNPTTLNISGKKKLIPKHIQSIVSKITNSIKKIHKIQGDQFEEERLNIFNKRTLPILEELVDPDKVSDRDLRYIINLNRQVWGISPGTQILHRNGFISGSSIQHHGVYIGFGLIAEIGAPGVKCKKTYHKTRSNWWALGVQKSACLGIQFLDDIVMRGEGTIYRVVYPRRVIDLNSPAQVRDIWRRIIHAIETSEEWEYNIFFHQCQHWASLAAIGRSEHTQWQCMFNPRERRIERIDIPQAPACRKPDGTNIPCRTYYHTNRGLCKDLDPSEPGPILKKSRVRSKLAGADSSYWCYLDKCNKSDPKCWDYSYL